VNETISVEELKRLAGEAEQIRAYSSELERKSRQIQATAAELAQANQRLREIDMQKDEFLSQVSHEVRTPMTSIRSFSDILIKNRDMGEAEKLRFLTIIQNESLRLTRLLDGILDLNQVKSGEPGWSSTSFDPETVLDQAMESCEALAHAAGVTLKRSGRARKASIHGNPDKLAQVFINLISNAIKYNISPAPVVTVASVLRKGSYEASIIDNGPGIPERERERIFVKFARGPIPRNAGAGLGLAISRQIVERFGGSLSLATSKSGGAEFIVRLQTAEDAARALRGS
jgi:signal transduction histidine kinase